MGIRDAILERFNNIRERIAQGIHDDDWSAVGWNVALIAAVVMVAVALAVGVLALVWKILGTLLGKIFAVPLVLFILGLSYKMNLEDSRTAPPPPPSIDDVEYEHELVCDATFLVLQDAADYTPNLISPSRPSTIECPDNPYTIEDTYVVHNFHVRTRGPVDLDRFKSDLRKTFSQKHRARELNGFSSKYTEIDGGFYCPLQILGMPQDFGDFIQIFVVRTTAETVKLTRAQRMLNLDNIGHARSPRNKNLTDDEL